MLRSLYKLVGKQVKKRIAPITHVETSKPFVALTFDDGPDPIYTPILLELFKQFRAHATFFMVGDAALKHKKLVDKIFRDGHEIGNHTMDHLSMMSLSRRGRWRQMKLCKEALWPHGRRYFRPPYGEQNVWTNLDAVLLGYQVVGWDLNVGDWHNTDFASMADDLLKKITNGAMILFHDAIYDQGRPKHKTLEQESNLSRDVMVDLVRLLFEECSGRFQFVTMTEMIKHGKALREEVLR